MLLYVCADAFMHTHIQDTVHFQVFWILVAIVGVWNFRILAQETQYAKSNEDPEAPEFLNSSTPQGLNPDRGHAQFTLSCSDLSLACRVASSHGFSGSFFVGLGLVLCRG